MSQRIRPLVLFVRLVSMYPKQRKATPKDGFHRLNSQVLMAEPTGFEPATSDVTGRRSNQLNYDSAQVLKRKNHSERQSEYRQKRQPIARNVFY